MATDQDALSYCGQQVRTHDHDRFLTTLFAPADRREALFALWAFNLEIAKTREVVREPIMGQIRLQWWRDAIAAAYGEGPLPEHAVTVPLAAAIRDHALSRESLDRLIDAREADLEEEPVADSEALAAYVAATAVPPLLLALQVLGVGDGAAGEAARHVGLAYGLTGLLRAVPFHARQQRVLLPADRLAANGGGAREILDLKPGPAVAAVVAELADRARGHLTQARALRRSVPSVAVPPLRLAVVAELHLATLAREGHDVFSPRVQMPNPFRQMRLTWAALRGRW